MSTLDRIKPLVALSNGLTDGQERWWDEVLLQPVQHAGYETWELHTNWFADEPYLDRLTDDIDRVRTNYKIKGKLALVGYSAGDVHAANIYGALAGELDELYFIGLCGRKARGNLRPRDWRTMEQAAHLNTGWFAKMILGKQPSPNFAAAIDYFQSITLPILAENQAYRNRAHLFHQIFDEVVPRETMLIPDVETTSVRIIGHSLGILFASRHLPQTLRELVKRK